MHKPVARIQVDTRGFGPVWCDACENEQEEVILSTDADFHCPECGAVLESFDDVARFFTSAQVVQPGTVKVKGSKQDKHVCTDQCRSYGCPLGEGRR